MTLGWISARLSPGLRDSFHGRPSILWFLNLLILFYCYLPWSFLSFGNRVVWKEMSDFQGKRQWKKEVSTSPFSHSFVFSLQRFLLYEKTSNNEFSESVAWDRPPLAPKARHANIAFSWLSLLEFYLPQSEYGLMAGRKVRRIIGCISVISAYL